MHEDVSRQTFQKGSPEKEVGFTTSRKQAEHPDIRIDGCIAPVRGRLLMASHLA